MAAGGSNGDARALSPHSVAASSLSSPTSLASLNSNARESDASVAFWALTHASFPNAALEIVKEKLFKIEKEAKRPISNRKFLLRGEHAIAFGAARTLFCAATLDPAKRPLDPTSGLHAIDFSPHQKFTSTAYEELEIDCLLKVPAQASCQWTRDPAQPCAPLRVAPTPQQVLPTGSAAAEWVSAGAGADRAAAEAAAAAANAAAGGTRSRFSLDFYPEHSSMYVVGEVYAPKDSDGTKGLSQKLQRGCCSFFAPRRAGGWSIACWAWCFWGQAWAPSRALRSF